MPYRHRALVSVCPDQTSFVYMSWCFFFSEAEKVVGWAKNHYLSSCLLPSVKGERLCLPRERYICKSYHSNVCICHQVEFKAHLFVLSLVWSLEIVLSRLKGMETMSRKPSQNLKACSLFYCYYKWSQVQVFFNFFFILCWFRSYKYGNRTLQRMSSRAISFHL